MLDQSQYRSLNKARQIGFTTCCAAEIAHYGSRGKGEKIVIISKSDEAAIEFMSYVHEIIMSMQERDEEGNVTGYIDPDFVPVKGKMRARRVDFEDGSSIRSIKSSSETGRSISASRIYFDEMNFTPYVDDIYQAIEPTLSQTKGSMTSLSTPKGRGTLFAKICREPDKYGFSHHQFEWWWCPTYNPYYKQWFEAYKADDEEAAAAWIEKAKTGKWYVSKRKKHSLLKFQQEFECRLDADVGVVFSQKQLNNTFYSHGHNEFYRDDHFCADVWWQKEKIDGHHYATGVDLGRKQDATVIITYDITELPAQMVEYIRIAPATADWAEITLTVRNTYAYFKSDVRVDSTGMGDPIAESLSDIADGYIISSNQATSSKYKLIENRRAAMDHRKTREPKIKELYEEHEAYTWDDKKIVQDSVIAAAIAVSIFYDPEEEGTYTGVDASFNYVEGAT
jgi:hypothetical protein